ncbi:MAG TPA: hypothetical protein DEA22_10665 [Blastocatellia bacterium]|nr:hypothetical protein [Blastocatellia bacterium]
MILKGPQFAAASFIVCDAKIRKVGEVRFESLRLNRGPNAGAMNEKMPDFGVIESFGDRG